MLTRLFSFPYNRFIAIMPVILDTEGLYDYFTVLSVTYLSSV